LVSQCKLADEVIERVVFASLSELPLMMVVQYYWWRNINYFMVQIWK